MAANARYVRAESPAASQTTKDTRLNPHGPSIIFAYAADLLLTGRPSRINGRFCKFGGNVSSGCNLG
jgi:hypothetical protein